MRKLMLLLVVVLLGSTTIAQEKTYLLFEFMKVEDHQMQNYWDVESHWEKIHAERIKNGDMVGWDLWRIRPGGSDQGSQYMTVHVFNDQLKMFDMKGSEDARKAAYPDMSDEDVDKMMKKTVKSRDIAGRAYIEIVDATEGEFDMPIGTVASMGFMKVKSSNSDYVKAETEVFKPYHQKMVDADQKENWQLLRVMLPAGSDTYAGFMAVNMFRDYEQYVNQDWSVIGEVDEAAQEKIDAGLETRDMRKVILIELVKKVR
jgi:hypothetical protein